MDRKTCKLKARKLELPPPLLEIGMSTGAKMEQLLQAVEGKYWQHTRQKATQKYACAMCSISG